MKPFFEHRYPENVGALCKRDHRRFAANGRSYGERPGHERCSGPTRDTVGASLLANPCIVERRGFVANGRSYG